MAKGQFFCCNYHVKPGLRWIFMNAIVFYKFFVKFQINFRQDIDFLEIICHNMYDSEDH